MALAPCKDEARAITLAKSPHPIVSVNDAWTKMTGYTQLDVEGKMLSVIHGERTVGDELCNELCNEIWGKPRHYLDSVARGECACSTNIYYNITCFQQFWVTGSNNFYISIWFRKFIKTIF